MRKRVVYYAVLFGALLFLTGCTGIEERVTEKMMEESGITEELSYLQYEQYSETGALDADDYYIEPEETKIERGTICVSFADNSELTVLYYFDRDCREPVTANPCYVEPGAMLYASVSVRDDVQSSMYSFSEFRVYEYDTEGVRSLSALSMKEEDGVYVLSVPSDFSGTELSLVPVGAYEKRVITLRDYMMDEEDQEIALSGTWTINEKEYVTDTAEINPVADYIISYRYDKSKYFFIYAEPDTFYESSNDDVVIFEQRKAKEETTEYAVELHEYLSVTLVSDQLRSVSVNGGETKRLNANEELTISGLKYGDKVSIQTNVRWNALENEKETIVFSGIEETSGHEHGYKYIFIVPEKGGEFLFNPSDYSYEHGTIRFMCFGETVVDEQILATGSRIYYYEDTAEDGYWLYNRGGFVVVSTPEETEAALRAIHFTKKVSVDVKLPQSVGGDITYTMDGKELTGDTVSTYSGAVISMDFAPWEGWYCNTTGSRAYSVGDGRVQSATEGLGTVFTEDEAHKPALSVTLEKSVGETMEFSLSASGCETEIKNYGGGWKLTKAFGKDADEYDLFTNTQKIIDGVKIGTEKPIQIYLGKSAIPYGKAVRIVVTKVDSEDREITETRYYDDLTNGIDPICIYPEGTNATATEWYESVDISIGVVEVETYITETAAANTKLTVVDAETGRQLEDGEMIEGSREVTVTIAPLRGYFVTGKNVTNGFFSKTMTFSQYQAGIASLMEAHPAKRYLVVTLDTSDDFAEYTYQLDGKAVSGEVNVQAGQKLELTYRITGDGYRLQKTGVIEFSRTKATKALTVTEAMDGTTLTRTDFGIEITKED